MEEMVAHWNPHQRINFLEWLHANSAVILSELFAHDRIVEEQIIARILILLRKVSPTF